MDWITTTSIIASFFAGMVALFAPCCVTILLPTYMASIFRQKTQVLKMTLIFFAGIATILLPIGLGAATMASFFKNFHMEVYIIGGIMMLTFGIMSFMGKGMSMLPKPLQPKTEGGFSKKSVFLLGIFSGASTSCCAPVLAGAMTLAILSGTFLKALVVIFAYIFGMTFPLFLLALVWDKSNIENSKVVRGKLLEFKLGQKTFYIHTTNLFAGILFTIIGGMLLYLALSHNTFWAPKSQVIFGKYLLELSKKIISFAQKLPDYIWGIIISLWFLGIIKLSIKKQN